MSKDLFQRFELTDGEKMHPLWLRLKKHCEDQLQIQRKKNDAPLSDLETATLRGHIKCLKAIISLGEDRPLTGNDSRHP